MEGNGGYHGEISGIEYELYNSGAGRNNIFSESNNGRNPLLNNPAPCAFCYVQGRSTVAMIPARTQCPDDWTTEYAGYLVSEYSGDTRKRSSYICLDEAPEVAVGGTNNGQTFVYPVEVLCGMLPCSLYPTGRELACVVCSKWQLTMWMKIADTTVNITSFLVRWCKVLVRPMSDTQQSWATLSLNFIAQQICIWGNCQFSIGKQSSVHSIMY